MSRATAVPPASSASRRGRPGRRPGAADTRGRILEAARADFGALGYDGATIRGVAARAGVDPALVHHYFGTKQRLFVTAMELPVDFARIMPRLIDGPPDHLGERLVRYVLELWDRPELRPLLLGIVRSASTDPLAAAMLRRLLTEGPMLELVRALARPDAPLRASLAGSQFVGLLLARYVVGIEPIASMDADALARIVGPSVQRYLSAELG